MPTPPLVWTQVLRPRRRQARHHLRGSFLIALPGSVLGAELFPLRGAEIAYPPFTGAACVAAALGTGGDGHGRRGTRRELAALPVWRAAAALLGSAARRRRPTLDPRDHAALPARARRGGPAAAARRGGLGRRLSRAQRARRGGAGRAAQPLRTELSGDERAGGRPASVHRRLGRPRHRRFRLCPRARDLRDTARTLERQYVRDTVDIKGE
mmetsp:Transcript_528/g.1616  ORF Transcript_528/g.1616 Transcript_528/m.1616 type:complete len:211 (+) Transcript_528:304-936(+)